MAMTVPIPDVNCSFPFGTNNNRDFHIWTGNDAVEVWKTKKRTAGGTCRVSLSWLEDWDPGGKQK